MVCPLVSGCPYSIVAGRIGFIPAGRSHQYKRFVNLYPFCLPSRRHDFIAGTPHDVSNDGAMFLFGARGECQREQETYSLNQRLHTLEG